MKKITFLFLFVTQFVFAQVPSPKSHFGFSIGDNYHLATFTQTEAYFQKVAKASPRVKLQSIGKTEEGRNQYMLIVSSPKNIKNLAKYKSISQRLARAENLTESEAKALAKEGNMRLEYCSPSWSNRSTSSRRVQTRRRCGFWTIPSSFLYMRIRMDRSWSPTGICAKRILSSVLRNFCLVCMKNTSGMIITGIST